MSCRISLFKFEICKKRAPLQASLAAVLLKTFTEYLLAAAKQRCLNCDIM